MGMIALLYTIVGFLLLPILVKTVAARELTKFMGRNVTIQTGERRIRGRAESLDDDGALRLRTEHGHLERVTGGDVTLEK